ncbi:MAG: iron ABC transporter permease [Acidimicrobiia bacterium]|nr:iron ABC transporter permease [Acidimicrobiia bacterium]
MTRRRWQWAIAALPALFLAWFFAYPLIRILERSLRDGNGFADVFGDGGVMGVIWFTAWQAAVSTLLTLLAGLPVAYVLSRFRFPGRALLRAIVTVPFVTPTVVAATAFVALLGDGATSLVAILLAHVFFNIAVVVRTVGGLWEHLDPRLDEAARTLGATRLGAFRRITLPLLRPAIAAAAAIVFLFTFTSFGVVLILGDLRWVTIEVEIWRQATGLFNLPLAAALSIIQIATVGAALFVYSRYQERRSAEISLLPGSLTARAPRTWGEKLLLAGVIAEIVVLLIVPLGTLVARSLTDGIDAYSSLAEPSGVLAVSPGRAIANSLAFGLTATALALVIGMAAAVTVARGRGGLSQWFDSLLMLPLGTSAVTIGFGLLISMDRPIDIRASWWIVPLAHTLVAVPFIVRTAVPVIRSVPPRLREAAATLGAAPRTVWRRVDAPFVARAAAIGAGFAFAVSLGEFGATTFLVRPLENQTIPTAIFRLLGQPGSANFAKAMALATILMLLAAGAVMAIDRLRSAGDF